MSHLIQAPPVAASPWWKHGHVWLLIAGPAAVVVAAFATAWIAVSNPDPVVAEDYYRRGVEINKTLAARDKALMPALQGRNHAATPPVAGAR
ncbi:FixH family protein [Polaromonas sp.]|uniref:FixH family protein n=1 Tax=Polaromonas sp. TaxID=1869339 RepID=UPI003CB79B85